MKIKPCIHLPIHQDSHITQVHPYIILHCTDPQRHKHLEWNRCSHAQAASYSFTHMCTGNAFPVASVSQVSPQVSQWLLPAVHEHTLSATQPHTHTCKDTEAAENKRLEKKHWIEWELLEGVDLKEWWREENIAHFFSASSYFLRALSTLWWRKAIIWRTLVIR